MRCVSQLTETEWASVLSVATVLAVFTWATSSLDPVSRAVTAALSGVAALVAGAVTLWAIRYSSACKSSHT
jgi:hypothetical protein